MLSPFTAIPWRLVGYLSVAVVVMGLYLALQIEQRQNDKLTAQLQACEQLRRQLVEESARKVEQTERVVTEYRTVTVPRVEREVVRIETAPLPGECRTPDAVMGADL